LHFGLTLFPAEMGWVWQGTKADEVVPLFLFPSIKEDLVPWVGLCCCGFPSLVPLLLVGLQQPTRCLDPFFLNALSMLLVLK